jgi:thiol-disulfide isomerase/thioredoxin
MRAVKSAFATTALYTALVLGANAAVAQSAAETATDTSTIEALRDGDMQKLMFHSEPQPVSQIPFTDAEGGEHSLADWQGKHVVVNFWATWCAPCRKEMPGLDRLQAEFGGDDFEVVTIATGRNSLTGIRKFFEETGVTNLPILLDPKSDLARDMAVLGLPITVLLDPEGREIARLRGDAEWDSESARAIVAALTDGT